MMLILATLIAVACYLYAGYRQGLFLAGKGAAAQLFVRLLGAVGVAAHTLAVYKVLHTPEGIQLGLFPVASLIAWLIAAITLVASLFRPLTNLLAGIFPLAAVAALLALIPESVPPEHLAGGIIVHILSSVAAYSIFAIAALQALLIACQDYQLRHHHLRGVLQALPPLQVMEQLLFGMLWIGMVLLSLSLLSGFIYVEDLFAQHLVHKTLLSILAWLLFAALLWGRHYRGWRGQTAIRWTLGGFLLLLIGFFGSKLVLELLGRS